MSFRERLYRFMQGRYGKDDLSNFCVWTGLALYVISLFFFRYPITQCIIYLFSTAFLAISIFRTLSKNHLKRQIENQRYLRLKNKLSAFFRLQKDKFKERKTHAFRRCPHCKAVMRLPRRRGKHGVNCPACRRHFKVFIWFGKK